MVQAVRTPRDLPVSPEKRPLGSEIAEADHILPTDMLLEASSQRNISKDQARAPQLLRIVAVTMAVILGTIPVVAAVVEVVVVQAARATREVGVTAAAVAAAIQEVHMAAATREIRKVAGQQAVHKRTATLAVLTAAVAQVVVQAVQGGHTVARAVMAGPMMLPAIKIRVDLQS
jgi:hypothetical protein